MEFARAVGIETLQISGSLLDQALQDDLFLQGDQLDLQAQLTVAQLQGKRAEAYELLAPIYGWFTEGFDTADLQEAKTLLTAVSGTS